MTLTPQGMATCAAVVAMMIVPVAIFVRMVGRTSCIFKHQDKKYVAVGLVDLWTGDCFITCHCSFTNHKYKARWACTGCGKMGEHCVKGDGDWTILQGQLVPDVKKFSNWSSKP